MALTPHTTYTGERLEPFIDSDYALRNIVQIGPFAPNLDLPAGTILAVVTASSKYAAYDNGNADGTETAVKLITQYPVVTDASGNITNLGGSGTTVSAPCFTVGMFRCEDIDNLDSAALTDLKLVLTKGTTSAGIINF